MVTYERYFETITTIESVVNSDSFRDVVFYIVDNGSKDKRLISYLNKIQDRFDVKVSFFSKNIGCPCALNYVLQFRKKGQHFIKIDNDVKIACSNWLQLWLNLIEINPDIGLIGGFYKKAFSYNRFVAWHINQYENLKIRWAEVYPAMGRFMFHHGEFLDKVGAFEVLSKNHLYGFEDLLMCSKAKKLNKKIAILPKVKIEHLQKADNYLVNDDEDKSSQVERLETLFLKRVKEIESGEKIYFEISE
jgi:GT2 family glycosyltransferase